MTLRQDPPNAIQITPVEGCNLRCAFCGIQAITTRAGEYNGFMSLHDAGVIAHSIRQAGWNPRIEINQHGEPSMHPQIADIISLFRTALPKAYILMTSNGGGLLRTEWGTVDEQLARYFGAGLNVLALDNYEQYKLVPRILEKMTPHRYPLFHYPEIRQASPHTRRHHNQHEIVILKDPTTLEGEGTHGTIINHAGNAFPPVQTKQGKRCAKPFREMSIRYDGNVALCCIDWRGAYQCGNVLTTPIQDVWNNAAFDAARRHLILGRRDFGVCNGCDNTSFRVGLLPDKYGKVKMPLPDEQSEAALAFALSKGTYAPVVLREWELDALAKNEAKSRAEVIFYGSSTQAQNG